ncbi:MULTISPECIES: sensor histidine kinase [Niastella]|uniref:Histidine kinase n=1 Tax=Niastella soli TaxID=2821487 RepID=A0ABS3YLD7_9BACT|nr:histidine kinase [Niastella soli]MBO9198695.1 histidine kinase [Niastella soli]
MKIRWREHEIIFIALLVIIQIIVYLKELYYASLGIIEIDYAKGFREAGLGFVYWKQVFLPQLSAVLLVFAGYLSVNLVIIPLIKKISFDDIERIFSKNIFLAAIAIICTSYLLALGANVISYFARPHQFSYWGHPFLAWFGYNDRPLSNVFQGFGNSTGTVIRFTALAGLREFICWLIGRPGGKREFRVLVTNNITPLFFIYLLVLTVLNPLHEDFLLYFGCITPVFLVYLFTTFWIFPLKRDASFLHAPVLKRILFTTFLCSLLSKFAFKHDKAMLFYSMYWAFLLLAVVPLSWLLYQQRKNQILQLKGMETALAKSDANLQMLRSQINPHFLFNALNTLYATALQHDSERTAEGIQQLGDMMRFMLEDNTKEFIPMEKEMDYLKNYISLQKLRVLSSPEIRIEENLEEVRCQHLVAPMLFIPFVENAFKHGISGKERSWIFIKMECSDKELLFEVRNSIHRRVDLEAGRTGIGLQNVKGRLSLLYPQQHELLIQEKDNEFIVRLHLKIQNSHVASDRN